MRSLVEPPGVGSGASDQFRRDEHRQKSKRIKLESGERGVNNALIDFADPDVLIDTMGMLQWGKYGSATSAMHEVYAHKLRFFSMIGSLQRDHMLTAEALEMGLGKFFEKSLELKNLQNLCDSTPVVILDSDDEEEKDKDRGKIVPVFAEKLEMPSYYPLSPDMLQKQQEELLSEKPIRPLSSYPLDPEMLRKQQDELLSEKSAVCMLRGSKARKEKEDQVHGEEENEVDVEENDNMMLVDDDLSADDSSVSIVEDDGLGDIWNQMGVAVEMLKDDLMNQSATEHSEEDEPDCDHSYVLKDDIGYVCRVCGVVSREIQSIIEIQYKKNNRSRTYQSSRSHKDGDDGSTVEKIKVSGHVLSMDEEISAHPRHRKQMKPHQIEGFNFLRRNLLDAENPGGCILAHAPGSGKTFMIISFMQSFLTNCPDGRPLVVLPKGILSTWKKEFQRWQIEDTLLLDFYSMKADNRIQQLEILKQWKDNKSILFMGYNSFTRILTDSSRSVAAVSCQEILINLPSIMILDEGHTPRNENTDVLNSLAKVKTPRKVVLSGTLYQNHVKEVFNVLNLVRPKFLKLERSKAIRKRIMSSVQISGVRKQLKGHGESAFFDVVEYALQEDEDHKRKEIVIRDLREMTSRVLHYYRGDFLDELPGLVDFTVLLKLTPRQKSDVAKLKKAEKMRFKRLSLGCAIYMHPILKQLWEENAAAGEKGISVSDSKIDEILDKINIQEGVKAKFFMTILGLCEAAGEKLLVFSQYLSPLKFLERLAVWIKGWSVGKEMFTISGDSNPDEREFSMDRFNNSPDAKVLFGSIKACGEGISLVGASRIIILDVHLNPSVSRQAIGRAFRPGQVKKVFVYRLVAADSPEEDDHLTCFKKELIAKRWFESDAYRGLHDFEMEEVDLRNSDDTFFERSHLAEDVKFLYKR